MEKVISPGRAFPHLVNVAIMKSALEDFTDGLVVKNLPSNTGDADSIPGWGTKIPHYCWVSEPACYKAPTLQ